MIARSSSALALLVLPLFVGVVVVSGCDGGTPSGDDPDDGDAGIPIIRFDAGPPPDPADGGVVDAGAVNSVVQITSVTAPNGPLAGGNRVVIEGDKFDPSCEITFGGVEATNCLFLTTQRMSCEVPPGPAAGPVDVAGTCALGLALLEAGYTWFSPVQINGITPSSGSTTGGTPVTITGSDLNAEMIVLLGERQVVNIVVAEDGLSATALTGPAENPGRVDVVAVDVFGRSVLPLAFTYVQDLELSLVSPSVANPGDVVELQGSGFTERDGLLTAAAVSDVAADRNNLINDERLRVVVPGVVQGSHDVSVNRGAVDARLTDALLILPPLTNTLTLTGVVPSSVDVAGGDTVTLAGEGLTTATTITIDGVNTVFAVVDDRRVTLTVPAGTAGGADVVVTLADASSATLVDGVTYVQRLNLSAVAPAQADAAGGTVVTLTGTGFVDGDVVTFGGIPCTAVAVASPTSLTCTLPIGAAGLVDVTVTGPDGQRAVRSDGFLFEQPLSVLGVKPSRGAYTGDVFVTISGTGFERLKRASTPTSPIVAFFGGAPGDPRELTVVSDNLITCRTPGPSNTGLLDVQVTIATVTVDDNGVPSIVLDPDPTRSATAVRVYTAFDPTSILGGTRGGPIDGAMYLTALDAITGLPVNNMLVFTGSVGEGGGVPTAADITHFPFGQATLSGPDIVGPQTISVVGDGYEHSTLVDVNASEVTLYLFPIGGGGPPGNGTPPPPPPPAQIRGRVFGFAKEFFDPAALGPDEIALAIVVTTARDEFAGTPNPGGDNVVFEEGGEFFIANSRPGRLGLVALAGIFNLTTQEFRFRQMGVRREVFPQFGVTLIDQDIDLSIPLDRDIDLSMPDAPLDFEIADINAPFGNGPDITRVIPFIQLGGEGAFAYTTAIGGTRNHALETMPDVPGEMLTFVAGAYSTTGRNLFTDFGTANLTANSVIVTGDGTEWDTVDPFSGQAEAIGKIMVVELADGSRFASDIVGVNGPDSVRVRDRAPLTATALSYHIGDAGIPSSEVIQDGVGDLRGGVTIQPVLGIPEVISPIDNGVLEQRTLRWRKAPGEQPTIHLMFLFEPFEFKQLWSFYIEGSRTKVPVPFVPRMEDVMSVLPILERTLPEDFVAPKDLYVGGLAWQHEAIFTPGLTYDNWSNLDISTRGRRAWTTNLKIFVHGSDE
ncbi:MAG: IPT/TIG domain-containing protein [Deltaproteobacteria bacterium]|nr:IPT/TIG domain-containing protein [Deltaproteobacteria bacterium]